ncbi:hypothetical protein [Shinella sp.]|uniref:hypothetical protein n=1 Tax=Shinella sp. TaxID=1870904 RepID=UPI004036DB59
MRSLLRKIAYEAGLKGEYTPEDVIGTLRENHAEAVAFEARKLEDIALRKMLSDIEGHRTRTFNSDQGEFFPELAGLQTSYDARVLGVSEKRGARILLEKLSVRLARVAGSASRKIRRNLSPADKLNKFLDDLQPYIESEDDLVADVIKRSRKS